MGIRKIDLTAEKAAPPPQLVEKIANQMKREPGEDEPKGEVPYIIEEKVHPKIKHVTVIWDEWGHLDKETRGAAILDAYKVAFGEEETLMISIAMGLTTVEAKRLGVLNPA